MPPTMPPNPTPWQPFPGRLTLGGRFTTRRLRQASATFSEVSAASGLSCKQHYAQRLAPAIISAARLVVAGLPEAKVVA
jgi:hypothetical protein